MAGVISHSICFCLKIIYIYIYIFLMLKVRQLYPFFCSWLGRRWTEWTGMWLWFFPPAILAGWEDNCCRCHWYPALLRVLRLSVLWSRLFFLIFGSLLCITVRRRFYYLVRCNSKNWYLFLNLSLYFQSKHILVILSLAKYIFFLVFISFYSLHLVVFQINV